MLKKSIALVMALPVALSLTGCVVAVGNDDGHVSSIDFEDREYENRRHIAKLIPNMSFADVQKRLGVADFNEAYQKDGEAIQVLFYRTHRTQKDGLTTKDECTPLVFKQGMLVSWGEQAYRQI